MRLFISYARVDRPFCLQVVDTLNVHEVWYDQRLYTGTRWWPEILRRLDWCEGFVYLLSPESVTSKYCREEFRIATDLKKHIFPVLIHEGTPIPDELQHVQYADLSKGLTADAVKILLNSIYIIEKEEDALNLSDLANDAKKPPDINPSTAIGEAAHAMAVGNFDLAVFLLRRAKEKGVKSRFIDLDALLREAEAALEHQTLMREAEREYKHIAALVKRKPTRPFGCQALAAFHKDFPDYDPENLAAICEAADTVKLLEPGMPARPIFTLPLLEWCDIPAGMVTVEVSNQNGHVQYLTFYVPSFKMSKYPVTNAQYQAFVDDPGGYAQPKWWNFSSHAREWRGKNPQPKPPRFKGNERPRENVTWYEAVAFCQWLSARTGLDICLPTEQQWQRAAQGDDGRLYPWGNEFDKNRCNTRESRIRMTTQVMRYPSGTSPYGVFDMAGNVWEWCVNTTAGSDHVDLTAPGDRAVHGGSFIGVHQRSQAPFHFYLSPHYFYATIGFRLVCNSDGGG